MQLLAKCIIPQRLEVMAEHCDWLVCRTIYELSDKKDLLALLPQLRKHGTAAKSAGRACSQPSFALTNTL